MTARGILIALVLLAAVGSTSCGYTLAGHGSFLPESIRVIGIPNFTNKTPYLDVEQMLTQRVRSEFIGRGKYKVLPQENDVDALLRVTVNSITLTPSSFTADQQASRYVISVVVGIEFIDVRDNNKVLWQNPSQVFREEYSLGTGGGAVDAASFFGQASNAVDRMASDFARSVVSAILEAF
jgi:hypothetical protein